MSLSPSVKRILIQLRSSSHRVITQVQDDAVKYKLLSVQIEAGALKELIEALEEIDAHN